jgi:hypothetical protein
VLPTGITSMRRMVPESAADALIAAATENID